MFIHTVRNINFDPGSLKFFIFLAALSFLSACSSSSSSGDGSPSENSVTGQAILGPLCGATVQLFQADDLKNAIQTTTANNTQDLTTGGEFSLTVSASPTFDEQLVDSEFYVVECSDGDDIDADDDGKVDAEATESHGTIHLLATGAQLKKGGFRVNILTELVYNQVAYFLLLQKPYPIIVEEMDRCSGLLLSNDIDGNGQIDHSDLYRWHPVTDKNALRHEWDTLTPIIEAVHQGNSIVTFAQSLLPGMTGAEGTQDTPGLAHGVVVSGSYAYIADHDAGLQVIDVSDPSTLTITGTLDLPNNAHDVAVSGSYAYVAAGNDGLQVIDISKPSQPNLVGALATLGIASGIEVSGDHVYLAVSEVGLKVVDISTPSSPTLVGFTATQGVTDNVTISGDFAYMTDHASGLQVIDISTPGTPKLTGVTDTPGSANGVAVSGNYAYVADGNAGLQIIDISKPGSPRIAGNVDTPNDAKGVAVSGNYAYIADDGAGLQIIDISTPGPPVLAAAVDTPGEAEDVAVSGNYAYVADGASGILAFAIPPSK